MKTRTIAGVRMQRTEYLGYHAWTDEQTRRLIFYLDDSIPMPAYKGQRFRSGRNYAPKWKCLLDSRSWPYNGAWYETIKEVVDRLDQEGELPR